ncbi:MAG: alpha/beta hydrolase [Chloroflexota bacterium]
MTTAGQPPRFVHSPDGTPIALFESGPADGPPLILVHGATSDHTTFRVVGPRLAERFRIYAVDRRGRGASGDGPLYAIEREFEDVATVADTVAAETDRSVVVVGHSYGGRVGLGAALRSSAIGRVVSYEGAPTPEGQSYHSRATVAALGALADAGDLDGLLTLFMTAVVGMPEAELTAFRADPVWPLRRAAARTIVREIDAEGDPAASLGALSAVRVPVLQILGGAGLETFGEATRALDARLSNGHVVVISGARHAAHHTHPDEFVTAVARFVVG